jgi:hypothetical protein
MAIHQMKFLPMYATQQRFEGEFQERLYEEYASPLYFTQFAHLENSTPSVDWTFCDMVRNPDIVGELDRKKGEPSEARSAGFGSWEVIEPGHNPIKINPDCNGHVLEMGFG